MITLYIFGNTDCINTLYHLLIINEKTKEYYDYYCESNEDPMFHILTNILKIARVDYKAVYDNDLDHIYPIFKQLNDLKYTRTNY